MDFVPKDIVVDRRGQSRIAEKKNVKRPRLLEDLVGMPVRRPNSLRHHQISCFGAYDQSGQNWRQQNRSQRRNPDDKVPCPRKRWLHGRRSKFHDLHSKSYVIKCHDLAGVLSTSREATTLGKANRSYAENAVALVMPTMLIIKAIKRQRQGEFVRQRQSQWTYAG